MRGATVGAFLVFLSCNTAGISAEGPTPCSLLCDKLNQCKQAMNEMVVDCTSECRYGGNLLPGLAPTPDCPSVAAQTNCIQAAVGMSCD